jgi:hypothetical protein
MKIRIITVAFLLTSAPLLAQMTGVSHPDSDAITSDDAPATPVLTPRDAPAKPAAGTPASAATTPVYGPYVPYTGAATASPPAATADQNATTEDAIADEDLPDGSADGKIVTTAPDLPGELGEGTLLQTRNLQALSTATTLPGTRFTAEIMAPVEKDGRVIIPIGSTLEGEVTQVHSGHRISGAASLHLETRDILLPDGTRYIVHAQLTDTSQSPFKVTDEGTLKRRDNTKENIAVASLTTGSAAAAGALLGGGVGAVVGAGVGAGISTVMWLKESRQATLAKDVRMIFSLTTPIMLTPLSNGSSNGSNNVSSLVQHTEPTASVPQ